MVLEAIMICVDNSEWMRNGDYSPSRFEAMIEAVNYLANAKLDSNQETTVGLLSMAGSRIEVHVSLCRSVGSIMSSLAKNVKVGGSASLSSSLRTAQLALKNRVNKNAKQRIIAFVGSPIGDSSASELERLGKQLRKNDVSVDVVNFGTENTTNDNSEKLEALINATNSNNNSHLVHIPPGPHIFSDLVLSSQIADASSSSHAPSNPHAAAAHFGGVDAEADPELAMALRMSMEEERVRQQVSTDTTTAPTSTSTASSSSTTAAAASSDNMMEEDDEEQLARAIALSMAAAADNEADNSSLSSSNTSLTTQSSTIVSSSPTTSTSSSSSTTAIAASSSSSTSGSEEIDISLAMEDPDFINQLLASVPGANPNTNSTNNDSAQNDGTKDSEKQGDSK